MGCEDDGRTGDRQPPASAADKVLALQALSSLPVSVAILDPRGTIVAVNDAWTEFGRRNGLRLQDSAVGSNYLEYAASDDPDSGRLVRDLKKLLARRLDVLTAVYPCHSPSEQRWFSLIGLPLAAATSSGVALLHINLTNMLPLPTRAAPILGRAGQEDMGHAGASADLDRMGEAITHSVSEALSSQLSTMLSPAGSPPAAAPLTRRQMEVLRLLGEGKTNEEIANALFRSPNTVKLHVSAILQRLNLKSRTQAALVAADLFRAQATPAPGDEGDGDE
jgi:DNA-binding CsgD family transcriptional regulator